ncbi:MAG TPA: hypothetical protein VFV37_08000 [Luteibaculaceae bacterium]|nr:hypothetical protein [Luteibaculaceae bacterium]
MVSCKEEPNLPPVITSVELENSILERGDTLRVRIRVQDDFGLDNVLLSVMRNPDPGNNFSSVIHSVRKILNFEKEATIDIELILSNSSYTGSFYLDVKAFDREAVSSKLIAIDLSGSGVTPRAFLILDDVNRVHYYRLAPDGSPTGVNTTYTLPFPNCQFLGSSDRPARSLFISENRKIFALVDSTGELLWTRDIESGNGQMTAFDGYTPATLRAFIATDRSRIFAIDLNGQIEVKFTNLPQSLRVLRMYRDQAFYGRDATGERRLVTAEFGTVMVSTQADSMITLGGFGGYVCALVAQQNRRFLDMWYWGQYDAATRNELQASYNSLFEYLGGFLVQNANRIDFLSPVSPLKSQSAQQILLDTDDEYLLFEDRITGFFNGLTPIVNLPFKAKSMAYLTDY